MKANRKILQTASGQIIDLSNPDPRSINIQDIAHGLSQMCRFSGQTRVFYSVADHSLMAALHSFRRSPKDQLLALLHDATEAYICDMPSPIKSHCPKYKKFELQLLNAILSRFGLPAIKRLPKWLKEIDDQLLESERAWLFTKNSGVVRTKNNIVKTRCDYINYFTKLMEKIHFPKEAQC